MNDKVLYAKRAAAQVSSISIRYLDYLIFTRELPARRVGRQVLVHPDLMEQFARRNHASIRQTSVSEAWQSAPCLPSPALRLRPTPPAHFCRTPLVTGRAAGGICGTPHNLCSARGVLSGLGNRAAFPFSSGHAGPAAKWLSRECRWQDGAFGTGGRFDTSPLKGCCTVTAGYRTRTFLFA